MKKILVVITVIVIAIFGISIIKDQIIKSVITTVASQITGAPVHIDGFSLGIFNQSVRITGFKMYNPEDFPKGILLDLSKIEVKYDLGALFKKKIHLVNVEIELKEMGLEKNKEGKLNVDSLKVAKQEKGKPAEQLPLQIDIFELGIGKIVLKDYSSGKEPTIQVYDLNIHKSYKNITSAQQLSAFILAEPMKAAGIQSAKIYGISMLAGVGVLPVSIAAKFVGKDSVQENFAVDFDKAYEVSLGVLKKMGKVTKEDKASGILGAEINSSAVTIKLKKTAEKKTQVIVSARKYLFPKQEIAGGVLYEISQKLK